MQWIVIIENFDTEYMTLCTKMIGVLEGRVL